MYARYAKLRDKAKVTDAEVARQTGLGSYLFSEWKKGKSAPKIDKLYKIAKYFDVPLEYFVDEKKEGN